MITRGTFACFQNRLATQKEMEGLSHYPIKPTINAIVSHWIALGIY